MGYVHSRSKCLPAIAARRKKERERSKLTQVTEGGEENSLTLNLFFLLRVPIAILCSFYSVFFLSFYFSLPRTREDPVSISSYSSSNCRLSLSLSLCTLDVLSLGMLK